MAALDCREKLTLADGSSCVLMKCRAFAHLPRFDLYDSSEALPVQCRMVGMLYRHLRFSDAGGRELATIRFKWSLPVMPGNAAILLSPVSRSSLAAVVNPLILT